MGGGGMIGGGMGGGGGIGGAVVGRRRPVAQGAAPTQSQSPDLLQNVRQSNSVNQGRQSGKLNKTYKDSGSKGGVGAGGMF